METGFLAVFEVYILAVLALSLPVMASVHILKTREDVSAAIAWMGLVWLVPVMGVVFYLLLGVNRIRRSARAVRDRQGMVPKTTLDDEQGAGLSGLWPQAPRRWCAHATLSRRLSRLPLLGDNSLTVFDGGQKALNAMIDAIDQATSSIALTSYIFQVDQAGRRFIKALERAKDRGVEIRVLVDAVGNWYGFRPVTGLLRRRNIQVASFNAPSLTWRLALFNMRTHRKMLILDGVSAFAGGVNIHRAYVPDHKGRVAVRDTHFSFTGPVVRQMMAIFMDDWSYATGEALAGPKWFPAADRDADITPQSAVMRAVSDGPDEDRPVTIRLLESALYAARDQVHIVTPYFIPDPSLIQALEHAALRGVKVCVIIPKRSNIPLFALASASGFTRLMRAGVHIYQSQPPFDHSKIMMVDDDWALVGSSNWDARSLRLNFEFNMELYGPDGLQDIKKLLLYKRAQAHLLPLEEHLRRPLWKRMLGRVLWLFSPYL